MYLAGIDKQALPGLPPLPTQGGGEAEEPNKAISVRTEADEMMEKIYSNMSACHVKAGNWKRAMECADQVSTTFLLASCLIKAHPRSWRIQGIEEES